MSEPMTHHSEPAREAVALLPCPFCGCAPNPVPQNDDCPLPDDSGRYHQTIWCENCGAEGGKRRTGEDSIQAWNRRASPAPAAGGLEAVREPYAMIVKRLLNPPFGTETSERLLMGTAADAIRTLLDEVAALASPAATSADTQGAVELLRKLEEACDNAAGKRSQATYDQMISDPGAEDALEELDIARREARIFLNPDLWRRANGER